MTNQVYERKRRKPWETPKKRFSKAFRQLRVRYQQAKSKLREDDL